jgi:UDP-N-acetylglucosamine 1-carboxyvinyltransferase
MKDMMIVEGGVPLEGAVNISPSKNSVLPLMAATLLTQESVTLRPVPDLSDVRKMVMLLESTGQRIRWEKETMTLTCGDHCHPETDQASTRAMRASFLVLGPLVARFRRACVSFPGGCEIGERPVDLHLKGLMALGAQINCRHGLIEASCEKLTGNVIYLDFPSVGGTENIMMAASLARGETIIINAAKEPEIVDLAGMINAMGGRVSGAGSDTIRIVGVRALHGTTWQPIADRIEAGTFMLAAATTRGDVTVRGAQPLHLRPVMAKLREAGALVEEHSDSVRVCAREGTRAVDIHTMPWPGFPTDLQAPIMVMNAVSAGHSVITETVFENRFLHVPELNRMGAQIKVKGRSAFVKGVDQLFSAPVEAPDLRAGAALVIAAMSAEGVSQITGAMHIGRGYEGITAKLMGLGAKIREV